MGLTCTWNHNAVCEHAPKRLMLIDTETQKEVILTESATRGFSGLAFTPGSSHAN